MTPTPRNLLEKDTRNHPRHFENFHPTRDIKPGPGGPPLRGVLHLSLGRFSRSVEDTEWISRNRSTKPLRTSVEEFRGLLGRFDPTPCRAVTLDRNDNFNADSSPRPTKNHQIPASFHSFLGFASVGAVSPRPPRGEGIFEFVDIRFFKKMYLKHVTMGN